MKTPAVYLWPAIIILGIIFLPIFTHHFSAHTDGFYIITQHHNWLGNMEAPALIMQGRPFFAWLNSFLGWHITDMSQFTFLRIFIFSTKIAASCLVFMFCCSLQMEYIWAFLTASFFVLLPANALNVLWTSNGMPESLALLFGVIAYVFLAKKNPIGSSIVFLVSLLTYQPMAMIVFAMMFLKMLCSQEPWERVRISLLKEIGFFGFLLGVYWAIVKIIILPFGKNVLGFHALNSDIYDMELVSQISKKYGLVTDLLQKSLAGTWDAILHTNVSLEWHLLILFWSIALVTILLSWKQPFKNGWSEALQKILAGVFLFLLANTPSLMPTNYVAIIGYRTFLASSFMGLVLTICYARHLSQIFDSGIFKKITIFAISFYFLGLMLVASWLIRETVLNYRLENKYIEHIAATTDYHRVNTVIVILNRSGDTIVPYDLPYEFGLSTTIPDHIRFMFDKYSAQYGKQLNFKGVYMDWPVFADDHTQVVDLARLRGVERNTYTTLGDHMQVQTSAVADQNISTLNDNINPLSPILYFQGHDLASNTDHPWVSLPGTAQETINISFMGSLKNLGGYKLDALCFDHGKHLCDFAWKIQTSSDGILWDDWAHGSLAEMIKRQNGLPLPAHAPVTFIRFILIKNDPFDMLIIRGLQLFYL